MHLVEPPALPRQLRGAERTPRVDDHIAMPQLERSSIRHGSEMLLCPLKPTTTEIDVPRNAFDGSFGMQLKRQPRDANRTFAFELFDPDRVEVTTRAKVMRKDDEVDRFAVSCNFKSTPRSLSGFY